MVTDTAKAVESSISRSKYQDPATTKLRGDSGPFTHQACLPPPRQFAQPLKGERHRLRAATKPSFAAAYNVSFKPKHLAIIHVTSPLGFCLVIPEV